MSKLEIRIGTRKSKLAIWQAKSVANELKKIGYNSSIIKINSEGDHDLTQPIYSFGIQGVFTRTLDSALLNNKIDIAVHSLKDVPTSLPKGIIVNSVLKRGNPMDVVLFNDKNKILENGTIGTGSLRRKAQWLKKFPLDKTQPIRGNINTRLEKLNSPNLKGVIIAKAAIDRLEINNIDFKNLDWMIPAPSQGAIGVASLESNDLIIKALAKINCEDTFYCTILEREFLRTLEGGCSAPIGALAIINKGIVSFKGGVFSLDGKDSVLCNHKFSQKEEPVFYGNKIAVDLLNRGGNKIINKIKNQI